MKLPLSQAFFIPENELPFPDHLKKNYLIVIPVQDEEAALPETLADLFSVLPENCRIAAGLNACTDNSRGICEKFPIIIGDTIESGYGYGCQIAIDAAKQAGFTPDAYLFFAADGANSPDDLLRLIDSYENDPNDGFILGVRDFNLKNWWENFGRALPNLILGLLCRTLGGQFFYDLGPLRLIERSLFGKMKLHEMVWGWTIEAQIRAAQMGIKITTISVEEHPRRAGEQKVSGVSLRHSMRIGMAIGKAALRTRFSALD